MHDNSLSCCGLARACILPLISYPVIMYLCVVSMTTEVSCMFPQIELVWSKAKAILRRHSSMLIETGYAPHDAMMWAMEKLTPQDCKNYIMSCGSVYQGDPG